MITVGKAEVDASWKRHCFSACAAGGSYGTALLFVPPKLIAHVCTGVRCSCRTASAASSTRPAPSSPLEIRAPIHGGHQSPWQEGEGVPPCSGEGCVSALSLELCPSPASCWFPLCLCLRGAVAHGATTLLQGQPALLGTAAPSWPSGAVLRLLSPSYDVESQPRSPQRLLENVAEAKVHTGIKGK